MEWLAALLSAAIAALIAALIKTRKATPNGPMPAPPLSTGTTQTVPPTNAYAPNPDTGTPEPKPDEEYPEEGQPPPEDDITPPPVVDPLPEPEEPLPPSEPQNPAPMPLPTPKPKVYSVAEQDAFFQALGLPYGTPGARRDSTEAFQYACAWTDLTIDKDFGKLTTAAAETCRANDYRISRYFHMYEFRCKGQDAKYGGTHCKNCRVIWVSRNLIRLLDIVRETIFKGPMSITTGYRCEGYNAFVGGIKGSAHILGLAADIPRRFSWKRFLGMGWHGIGKSSVDRTSVVHVDQAPWLKLDHVFQE